MNWTYDEISYLKEQWGQQSLPTIAHYLGRTVNAVKLKANRLQLGAFCNNGDYIVLNQLMRFLGFECFDTYKKLSWIENRQFPVKKKKINVKYIKIVYICDFWKWAENNMHMINFANVEENILGAEPAWVKTKRKYDYNTKMRKSGEWTNEEDKRLQMLVQTEKYTEMQVANMLRRNQNSIRRRKDLLFLEGGFIKEPARLYTAAEQNLIEQMIVEGADYYNMSLRTDRSERSVSGYVARTYRTEKLEEVRKIILEERKGKDGSIS